MAGEQISAKLTGSARYLSVASAFPRRCSSASIVDVRRLAIASIVVRLITCSIGISFQYIANSPISLSAALHSTLDMITSACVLWRFWGHSQEDVEKLEAREHRADVLIGFSFIFLAAIVLVDGILNISNHGHVSHQDLLLGYSITIALVSICFGTTKVVMSIPLESKALRSDGINDFFGFLLALSVTMSVLVTEANNDIWYIDAATSIVVAVMLAVLGNQTVVKYSWWRSGKSMCYSNLGTIIQNIADFWIPRAPTDKTQTEVAETNGINASTGTTLNSDTRILVA